jgi:pimeloyl-ACP methyl ester carboxylesterase
MRSSPAASWLMRGIALCVLVLAAGCGSAQPSGTPTPTGPLTDGHESGPLSRFYSQRLDWWSCKKQFQCTNLVVPLDYSHPDNGRTVTVAVIRAPATDQDHRIGSLITNPGGPGESGVQDLEKSYPDQDGQPSNFGAAVRAQFDIVSFDPRGVGHSDPVTCLSGRGLDRYNAVDTTPSTPEQVQDLAAADQSFAEGCEERSGQLLPFVGTPNAARDMDILRAALGDQKLNYLGYSYGTYLGAVYADLFPTRVGRTVLDGALPPEQSTRQADLDQAVGFQTELTRFIADCVTRPDCPLGQEPGAAATKLAQFFASAQTQAIPTESHRTLNESLAQTGVLNSLYDSPSSWPQLRSGLAQAMNGNGQALLRSADEYNGRHGGGHYSNSNEANVAIDCLDHPDHVRSVADVQAELPAFQKASPLTGASGAWAELLCSYWPVPPQTQPHPVHYSGSPPILVIGNANDPATPYSDAQDLARQLGSSVLLTYDYDGHTAYGRGSHCIDDAVDHYLTSGVPPAPGTRCRPDPTPPS